MSLTAILEQLRRRIGLQAEALGPGVVPAAVQARCRALGLPDPDAYAAVLAGSEAELAALVEAVVVPETWFFRGGALFAHLADHIARALRAGPPRRRFRILSLPCASGEEPYSLAIALREAQVPAAGWTIHGIDVSARLLERARAGRYGELSFRQTAPEVRERYFRPVEGGWELLPAVRDSVRFRQGNLLHPDLLAGEAPYDLVFCRNLFIYLHPEARRQALANLERVLCADGLLCLGHAEPLDPGDTRFEGVPPEGLFLYRRRADRGTGGLSCPPPERRPTPVVQAARLQLPPAGGPPAPRAADRQGRLSPKGEAPAPPSLEEARRLADEGKLAESLACCRALLRRGAPSAALYSLLGVVHQARHEGAEAVRCFEKALYLEPEFPEALMHLMLLCRQQGDSARATLLERRLTRARGGEP
jgi:chemotaxis protein methyltransferase WspC